ncbi:uncharacterized protein LOC124695209 [Lolium rigidum]|uniref:uncharacterized protein LOC124695209 n=1 Tax=Lolium rigidum TaxID=89674 RepID=UPI001F5D82CE|nr:uncharacterized protein LOC124695209 [Lolium rigidum]
MAKASLRSTTMLGVSLVALLLLIAVQEAAPGVINYDAMRADHIPGKSELVHPGATANKYTPGCGSLAGCRDGNAKPSEPM